jgi:hypothetical protein
VDFLAQKYPTASAGFEPAILGTRGQHANHKTTKYAKLQITETFDTESADTGA